MKKTTVFIMGILFLVSGCYAADTDIRITTKNKEAFVEMAELDKKEIELLCSVCSQEFEKEAVCSGNLFDFQKKILERLRTVNKYLNRKYPDFNIEVKEIVPDAYTVNEMAFCFSVNSGTQKYTAKVRADGTVADDYYIEIIKPKYEKAMKAKLESYGISVIAVEAVFSSLCGIEINADLTEKDFFAIGNKLPRHINIYINSDNSEQELNKVKSAIEEEKIYGSYLVYCSEHYLPGFTSEICDEMWRNNKSSIESISFRYGF